MNDQGWHIKKEFTIGHIFTTFSVIFGVLWWSSDIQSQITLLHREDKILHESFIQLRDEHRLALNEIKGALIRIEEKLDRKQDRKE